MLNRIYLMGRLVADPECRQTPSGVTVATFRIAVDRDYKNRDTGERETDFVTIVAWRGTAEFVSRYFSKGRMAVVEGRLQIRPYTDRDGNKRSATEVVADNIYFGDSKRDGDTGSTGGYSPRPAAAAPMAGGYDMPASGADQFTELDDDIGDLPF